MRERPFCGAGVYLVNRNPDSGFHVPCERYGVEDFPGLRRGHAEFWLCREHADIFLAIMEKAYGF